MSEKLACQYSGYCSRVVARGEGNSASTFIPIWIWWGEQNGRNQSRTCFGSRIRNVFREAHAASFGKPVRHYHKKNGSRPLLSRPPSRMHPNRAIPLWCEHEPENEPCNQSAHVCGHADLRRRNIECDLDHHDQANVCEP